MSVATEQRRGDSLTWKHGRRNVKTVKVFTYHNFVSFDDCCLLVVLSGERDAAKNYS